MSLQSCTTNNLIIIWLDAHFHIFNKNTQKVIIKLQNIVNCIKIFTDADECIGFVHNIKDKKVFMIISNTFNQYSSLFLHLIEEMVQIYSMYIIGDHQAKYEQYKKLKGVFTEIEYIFDSLKHNVQQGESSLVSTRTDSTNLDKLNPSYIYSKLIIEIILKIQYDEEAMKIFTNYWREQYTGSSSHLKRIDEFERHYKDQSPVSWYIKEFFLYSSLNRALRLLDIDMIIRMGFFIQDLYREMERLHSEAQYTDKIIVYRGQGLSNADFETIKKGKEDLLSFNNFLSTSADRDVSLMFADSARSNLDIIGVLFQMEVDPSISSIPFVQINIFDEDREILFSMHTVFRISDIQQIDNQLWQIKLILTSDTDSQLECLADYIRNEIEDENPLNRLALLMNKMGHFDKAKEIYTTLLETTSSATNYSSIGLIYQSMGNYSTALSYYEKTLEIDKNSLPYDHPSLAITYNNIAGVHQSIGNYSLSLSFYTKALEIKQKSLPPNHPSLATTYNNIGEVYSSMGEYSKALSFYEEALKIQRKYFPYNHLALAITYNNIGSVHRLLGNTCIAIEFYDKTLEIELHYLLPNHPSLAITYNNIGLLHSSKKNYPTALSYYEKALEIGHKTLPSDHSSLALLYNNIGEVYDSMENHSVALSFYEKSLEILQKSLPPNHPELAAVYNNIGEVYRSTGNYSRALLYYENTLKIEQKALPLNHPSLAITYTNMAVALEDLQRYNEAIELTERAVDIIRHTFESNHSKTKEIQNYLDKLRKKL